jgi:hypothetical protein
MTEAEINAIAARIYGTLVTEQEFNFARALLASERVAREGWKLVPLEPTNKMTAVGQEHRYQSVWSIGAIYREMLAASPTAPAQSCGDAEQADEAVTDAELLNWLDAKNAPFKMGWRVNAAPAGNVSVGSVIQLGEPLTPIREAIATARAKDSK